MSVNLPIDKYIISPREVCQSCSNHSGPKFTITPLLGPSKSDAHRMNIPLNKPGSNIIMAEIGEAEIELDNISQEIERIESTLNMLRERREDLRNDIANKKSLFSPVRKLPLDVLSHIFEVCIDNLANSFTENAKVGSSPEVLKPVHELEQTCTYWRFVAHSTPRLWSYLTIPIPCSYGGITSWSGIRSLTEKFITLSGKTPLTIKFLFEGYGDNIRAELGLKCLKTLAGSINRWKNISGLDSEFLNAIMDSVQFVPDNKLVFSAPALTHVSLHMPKSTYRAPPFATPSLTHLEIKEASDNIYNKMPHFPWEQITHFFSTSPDEYSGEGDIYTILNSMTNLVSLSLEYCKLSKHVIFPNLEELSLNKLFKCLHNITAPNLRLLRLKSKPYYFKDVTIIQLFERSNCLIEELELDDTDFDEFWTIPHLRNVKRLHLVQETYWNRNLRYLNRGKLEVDLPYHNGIRAGWCWQWESERGNENGVRSNETGLVTATATKQLVTTNED